MIKYMKKNTKGFISIALFAVISIVIATTISGGFFYIVNKDKISQIMKPITSPELAQQQTTSTQKIITSSTENFTSTHESSGNGISIKTEVQGQVTKTTDCGDVNCFESYFSQCKTATLDADIGSAAFRYSIVGLMNNGCKITMRYTKNPNPTWVNQDMTCIFDNKLSFENAASKIFEGITKVANGQSSSISCSGSLYSKMTLPESPKPIATMTQPTQTKIQPTTCSDKNCFDKAFASCNAGSSYLDNNGASGSMQFTISSKVSGGCKVNLKAISLPTLPALVGLDMDCTMNNSSSFDLAKDELNNKVFSEPICSGSLFQALNSIPH